MDNPEISSYDDLSTDPNTGEVNEEPHKGGEFFSSILWDLHNSMSPTDVDFLAYDALYRVTGDPDFLDFRDAMMAADNQAYSGSHDDLIQNTFAARGVGNFTPLNVTISGPSSINLGENATWSASVSEGTSPYTFAWYKKSNTSNSWTNLGSGSSITTSSGESFTLKVEVNDSGSRSGYDEYPVYVLGGIHP
ncbi:MAG TPA: M36 family metallopeptidase [Balneolaceae bacterium]|nr:M36 family metallopeptidase [Balneolaceae bacterium]